MCQQVQDGATRGLTERSGGTWAPSQFRVLDHLHGLHLRVALPPQWPMTASPPSSCSFSVIFSFPRFLRKFQDGALSTQATCPVAGEMRRCDVFIFWSPVHSGARGWGQFHPTGGGRGGSQRKVQELPPGMGKEGQTGQTSNGLCVSSLCCSNKLSQNDPCVCVCVRVFSR